MIDTIALKTSIIDLAVSGKLSSRFQASDSVSDILAALPEVSSKRKKLLEQAFEYGDRHEIPSRWKWIRLGEIASYGDTPTKAFFDDVSGDTWILDLEDIKAGGTLLVKTRVQGKKFVGDKTVFKAGQILYSKLRPYLKKVLVADEDGVSTPELISFDTFGGILPQYIVYCLWSSFTDRAIDKRSYGIKMPRVDTGFMVNLPIPLPPVSEQQFIVERVQSAFSALDTIDALQAKYADNLAVLKSKLIDAAIQGKLTEQLPEDGTAEELYRQIQAEKQALIKSGKIKKEKPLPEIAEDKEDFDIPENWRWVSVGNVCTNIQYGSSKKSSSFGKMAVLRMGNIQAGKIVYDDLVYTSDDDEIQKHPLEKDDLLFNRTNSMELVGKTAIYKGEMPAIYAGYLVRLTPLAMVSEYLNYVMQSKYYWDYCRTVRIDSNGQSNINAEKLKRFVFPLPPLAEQKRIVKQLDTVLTIVGA